MTAEFGGSATAVVSFEHARLREPLVTAGDVVTAHDVAFAVVQVRVAFPPLAGSDAVAENARIVGLVLRVAADAIWGTDPRIATVETNAPMTKAWRSEVRRTIGLFPRRDCRCGSPAKAHPPL